MFFVLLLSKLYFSVINGNSPRIFRVNLKDGSGISVFYQTGLKAPNDLDIDYEVNSLMWTDSGTNKLEALQLTGGTSRLIRGSKYSHNQPVLS